MKDYIKNLLCLLTTLTLVNLAYAQHDTTLIYKLHKDKIVLYSDLGYNSAPFSIAYPFSESISTIKYRNNYKPVLGIGGAYKWLAIRIAFAIGENIKPTKKFGTTNFRSIRASYTHKRTYYNFNLRGFNGFAIKDAYTWNDSITKELSNDIRPNTTAFGMSLNGWYFNNENLNMDAVYFKRGQYKKNTSSFYIKNSLNIYGIENNKQSLIPSELIDVNNTKTSSPFLFAIDFGVIPGYAFILKKNNWQFSSLFGLGGVFQNKYYRANNTTRGFLGLAPRLDIISVAGYSNDDYFIFISADFNNKSIRYNELIYKQNFYHLKLIGGIRINKKVKTELN